MNTLMNVHIFFVHEQFMIISPGRACPPQWIQPSVGPLSGSSPVIVPLSGSSPVLVTLVNTA